MATVVNVPADKRFENIGSSFGTGFSAGAIKGIERARTKKENEEKRRVFDALLNQLEDKKLTDLKDVLQMSVTSSAFETPEQAIKFADFYSKAIAGEQEVTMQEVTIDGKNKVLPMTRDDLFDARNRGLAEMLGLPTGSEAEFGSSDPDDMIPILDLTTGREIRRVKEDGFDASKLAPNESTIEDFDRKLKLSSESRSKSTESRNKAGELRDITKSKADASKAQAVENRARAKESRDINKAQADKRRSTSKEARDQATERRSKAAETRAQAKEARSAKEFEQEQADIESGGAVDIESDLQRRAEGQLLRRNEAVTKNSLARETSVVASVDKFSNRIARSSGVKLNSDGTIASFEGQGDDLRFDSAITTFPDLLRQGLSDTQAFKASKKISNALEVGDNSKARVSINPSKPEDILAEDFIAKLTAKDIGKVFKVVDSSTGEVSFLVYTGNADDPYFEVTP